MNQYERNELKEQQKHTQEYIELQRDQWIWDDGDSAEIETLKQDEVIRMDWQDVMGSEDARNTGLFIAGALLIVGIMASGEFALIGGLLLVLVLQMVMRGRSFREAGWGKWMLLMFAISLFSGQAFGIWMIFLFVPFFGRELRTQQAR